MMPKPKYYQDLRIRLCPKQKLAPIKYQQRVNTCLIWDHGQLCQFFKRTQQKRDNSQAKQQPRLHRSPKKLLNQLLNNWDNNVMEIRNQVLLSLVYETIRKDPNSAPLSLKISIVHPTINQLLDLPSPRPINLEWNKITDRNHSQTLIVSSIIYFLRA